MTLTKPQKIYGAVMMLAAGALAWDRASTGPAVAEASGVASLLIQPTAKSASEIKSIRDDGAASFAASPAGHRFRQRLAILARDEQLDPAASGDAFGVPKKWVAAPVQAAPLVAGPPVPGPNQKRIEAFQQHHLAAVMVGHRGYANVDGQGVFVGETFDEFKLLSVTKTAAIFECEGLRAELRLVADSKLNRKGSVIENAAPRGGMIPLK